MTTLGQLIDRAMRDWLEPADDQPARLVLSENIDTDDDTDISFDASLIGPEELEILGPGSLVQIDSEEMIIGELDEDASTVAFAKRGANGTTAAAHTSGTFIYPHPVWRRRVVFDALCDGVVKLYPDLTTTRSSAPITVGSTTYIEVPDEIVDELVDVKHFLGAVSGSTVYDEYAVRLINPAPFVDSGKAFLVDGLMQGASGYLIYKAKFIRPTSEATDITASGVELDWEQIAILDAVAYLIAGRELDIATQERLSEQLEQQGYPAGTPSQIRDSLLRYREVQMRRAKDALRIENPVIVTTNVVI